MKGELERKKREGEEVGEVTDEENVELWLLGGGGRTHRVAGQEEQLQETVAGCVGWWEWCSICECNYRRPPKSNCSLKSTLQQQRKRLISFRVPFIHENARTKE